MLTGLIITASIAQIILALFVFFRSRANLSYRLFFFIGLSTLGWALADYLSTIYINSPNAVYMARFVLFFVVLQNAFFYMFARTFPKTAWEHSVKGLSLYILSALVVAAATLSPFIFKSVETRGSTTTTQVGPLIVLFLAQVFISAVAIFVALINKLRHAHGTYHGQLQILLFVSCLLWIIVPITNFGVTQLTGTTIFTKYAPIYTLAFTGLTAYAIISRRLFDIRAAVARSVAYVLLVGTLAAAYLAVFFGIINVVFAGNDYETAREVSLIVLMFPIIISFQRLKDYFDRVTNRLFYQDSYDIQEVLDKLGQVVAEDIDLHRILSGTRRVLGDAVRCSFLEYILIENGQPKLALPVKLGGQTDITQLGKALKDSRSEIISREQISQNHPLRPWFEQNNIAVSLKLKTNRQLVGFILFGDKRSGDIYNKQDIGLLTITADELAIAIQNALRFEQIQRFNVTLQEKVDEATRQLRHANHRLRELDATKDEFISMASHQLRTPLTTIKGYLSMVLEGDVGKVNKNEKQMIQQAFDSAERMVFLIADLLNISRLQSGKFVIDNKPTDLAKMVETEVSQLQETAANHHLKLTYEKPDKFPLLNLDEMKIRQVVMNFMDNAIYYTPAGGSVEVKLEASEHEVSCMVIDTGLGVPKAEQHHLFTKFYRAGNARKMRPDGTGLGLFMAKKVITAQGGAIIFRSTEGKGSTFGFSFPRAKVEIRGRAPVKSEPDTVVA